MCLIGDTLVRELFAGVDPLGRSLRIANDEFMVVGVMEKIGSVLGQDQDNFVLVVRCRCSCVFRVFTPASRLT